MVEIPDPVTGDEMVEIFQNIGYVDKARIAFGDTVKVEAGNGFGSQVAMKALQHGYVAVETNSHETFFSPVIEKEKEVIKKELDFVDALPERFVTKGGGGVE